MCMTSGLSKWTYCALILLCNVPCLNISPNKIPVSKCLFTNITDTPKLLPCDLSSNSSLHTITHPHHQQLHQITKKSKLFNVVETWCKMYSQSVQVLVTKYDPNVRVLLLMTEQLSFQLLLTLCTSFISLISQITLIQCK